MNKIYFLGREDREGLDLLQSNKRGLLTFDAEVGGWDTPGHNDTGYAWWDNMGKETPAVLPSTEPALHVFDSKTIKKQEPSKCDGECPGITYQVRFGSDH